MILRAGVAFGTGRVVDGGAGGRVGGRCARDGSSRVEHFSIVCERERLPSWYFREEDLATHALAACPDPLPLYRAVPCRLGEGEHLQITLADVGPEPIAYGYIAEQTFAAIGNATAETDPETCLARFQRTTRFLGAGDTLRYPSSSGRDSAFELSSQFHRLDLALRKRFDAWDFLIAPALRFDRNSATSQFGLDRRSDVVGLLRAEIGMRPVQRFHLTVGADTQRGRYSAHQYRLTQYFAEIEDVASRGTESNSGVELELWVTLRRRRG